MSVSQWSTTAGLNTLSSGTAGTGGVDIDEGCAPSGINNAIRDVMAQLKTFFTDLADGWAAQPIGVPIPVFAHLAGIPLPPAGTGGPVYIVLTAGEDGSGEFNEGKLVSESVSGSAPLVLATAVINVSGSPINGQTVRLINSEERVLRGHHTAGTAQNDQMQTITGQFTARRMTNLSDLVQAVAGAMTYAADGGAVAGLEYGTSAVGGTVYFNSSNSPGARTGTETRAKSVSVRYYMRVK